MTLTLADAIAGVRASGRSRDIRCPAHEDHRASLSVGTAASGAILLHCHAGCSFEAVVAAAGLEASALGPSAPNGRPVELDILYDYVDERGRLLFQVVRKPGKVFRQRRPDPARPGEWLWHLDETRRVLYRLPQVLAAVAAGTAVWVVEGEKDVHACEARGLVATCNPGGAAGGAAASKWRSEYSQALGGGHIVIVQDKDDAGRAHALSVQRSLTATGVASWRVVEALEGKDAADHFAAGHASTDFVIVRGAPAKPEPRAAPATAPEYRLTEGGNADRFVAAYGDDARYVEEAGAWYLWDGMRFRRDASREVHQWSRNIVGELYTQAAEETDQSRRRQFAEHAKKSDSAHAVRAMLDLARSARPIARCLDDFDRHLDTLTVANGSLDLRTGELRPSARAEQSTRCAPVAYDPDATCPRFEDFLWTICRERPALIRYVQKAVGYSLTGDTTEQCLFLLYGSGANGKSTFLETVRLMLGDYGHTAKTETVLLSRDERSHAPRPDLLDLRGRRLVTASEVVEGKHFNEALVKSMTGGEELNARGLYASAASTFRPTHKLWIGVNHLPVIRGDEEAIWRRIRVIPFDYTVPADQRDPALPELLTAERPGILAWAVQGCLAWRRERLGEPPAEVRAATTAYREDSDILADFLTERCTVEPNARVTGGVLYGAYKAWALETGLRPITGKAFAGKIVARGFNSRKSHGIVVYDGIGVPGSQRQGDTDGAELWRGEG